MTYSIRYFAVVYAVLCSLVVHGQDKNISVRTREARQALAQEDFGRAEKLSLLVMQMSDPNDTPMGAWRVYAECRFRAGGYVEALKYFTQSVRPNSDDRVTLMQTISALESGDTGGHRFLGHLSLAEGWAKRLDIDEKAFPVLLQNKGEGTLAYSWLALSILGKGQLSLDDAGRAEKYAPNNFAINWVQGVRLYELGKFREARAQFLKVSKSDFKKTADRAKVKITECDAKLKIKLLGGAPPPSFGSP